MSIISAAGILPKSTYNGTEYYYFGLSKNSRELSTFCGKLDKNEKPKKGAIREFMEESLGAIVTKEKIKKILENKSKVSKIENPKAKQRTYIAAVKIKENPMKKFQQARVKSNLPKHKKEVLEIVAIKTSDLIKALTTNNHFYKGHQFRGDAWGTLQIAHSRNLL
jgi:hypothetical protein